MTRSIFSCHPRIGKISKLNLCLHNRYRVSIGILLACTAYALLGIQQNAQAAEAVSDTPIVDSLTPLPNATEQWSIHAQSTYISQWKNNFNSPYYGEKSMLNKTEGDIGRSYTFSATAFLGVRLWEGAEVYYNPEMFEGLPFSNFSGLGGFTNGELQKGITVPPSYYTARAFIRQTIGLGGGKEHIEGVANQLAGNVDKNRLVLNYGKFAALDFFDANTYSRDPRTQFLNYAIMSSGAYSFAADTKGYTYGVVAEWYQGDWVTRAARFAMPTEPNTMQLDYSMTQDYGNQVEITRAHTIGDQVGKIRALWFQTHAYMANYQNAINLAYKTNTVPSIYNARQANQTSWGYGLNAEQALTKDVGIFARWSWNNGQTETQTYDISKSLSGGVSVQGSIWNRKEDTFGLAFAVNGISASEINYLQLKASTMFIGDGALQYKPEQIIETYYSFNVYKGAYLTADYQRIANPAYNAARGPVNFFSLRAHLEF